MVNSLLDDTVNYIETSTIEPSDLDYDANLYETTIFDKNIIFALGKPNYTYIDNNIVYYSMYLVENDEIKLRIGLYEIMASDQETILDEDGDIDLNQFDKPLLYSFTYEKIHKGEKEKEREKEQEPDMSRKEKKHSKKDKEHSKKDKEQSRKDKERRKKKWIKKFMKDNNYDIIDVAYDGNCFFSTLKLALEENGQAISVDDMRDILVNNATEELFKNYKEFYDNYRMNEAELTREIKNIKTRMDNLQSSMKETKDRSLIASFDEQSSEMNKTHRELIRQRDQTHESMGEVEFMNGIENFSMFKLKIKTNEFWADTWVISTLERELNIKTIIFSEQVYSSGDELNVLQCGQQNDSILQQRGIFEPSYYVLVAYHRGSHYQLITYNNQKSFPFIELPEEVKVLVSEKCLEKIAGIYSIIPEFMTYSLNLKFKGSEPIIIDSSEKVSSELSKPDEPQPQPQPEPQPQPQPEPLEELSSDLYDSGTVFRFYSKSIDKPLPGKGSGETLGPEGNKAYEELSRIPEWRKKLSNFWPAEFTLDGHRWLSVEHYYQGSKFKKNNKDFYIKFSLDSPDSSISNNTDMAKAAGGKSGKFKGELVRPKNVKVDPDFFPKSGVKTSEVARGVIEMESAMRAKFSQNPDLKKLLLATKKAKLEHIRRGEPSLVLNDLMHVRRELKESV